VIVDFRPDPSSDRELREAAARLRYRGAGVLIGEHLDDVTSHRPSVIAAAVAETGLRVISTLTCRDRTAAQARAELEALADLPLVAVHCVTGDHPAARFRADATAEFSLDSIELIGVAATHDVAISVAESPAAAPESWRPQRLLDKQRAGASMAILNHGGNVEAMIEFADRCHDRGVVIPLIAPVPVITDHRSAEVLARFPGLVLPSHLSEHILEASNPEEAGVAAAVAIAQRLLESRRFAAVNLSGSAAAGGVLARSRIMARVAARIDR
jgi:5,10-methylenetetrahydrofolate reductase